MCDVIYEHVVKTAALPSTGGRQDCSLHLMIAVADAMVVIIYNSIQQCAHVQKRK